MIVCLENPKKSTNKKVLKLKLVSEFSKVAGYKINMQKTITFLSATNDHVETKLRI